MRAKRNRHRSKAEALYVDLSIGQKISNYYSIPVNRYSNILVVHIISDSDLSLSMGYVGGVAGIIVGSPLDVLKVRLQTSTSSHVNDKQKSSFNILINMKKSEGVCVGSPIIGLAFLNSILFASYGGILRFFKRNSKNYEFSNDLLPPSLFQVYLAGFGAGFSCSLVSTPTELIKCLYQGGLVTIIRDAPGYGVYFWAYEGIKRLTNASSSSDDSINDIKLLFSGGMAGVISWASIYPLDVIKTRIQTQPFTTAALMMSSTTKFTENKLMMINNNIFIPKFFSGIINCTFRLYSQEGISGFFKGITPTLIRAWPVNAVTFYIYEIMINWLNRIQK
ncbi:333_t:CDS:2 [Diversispora eburnea]|uniref:333_t:CDS:1 n=1 Tax=Diversispora eburnea TaxID=1213867 RepID=A0A9N9B1B7_9GLOM|nr:333_t:CDS:2 [Diversispora eburnea]